MFTFLVRLCFLVRSTKTSPEILDSIYFHLSSDICSFNVSFNNKKNKGKLTHQQTNKTSKQKWFPKQEKYLRQLSISYYRDTRFKGLCLQTKSTDTFASEEACSHWVIFSLHAFQLRCIQLFLYRLKMSLLKIVKQ